MASKDKEKEFSEEFGKVLAKTKVVPVQATDEMKKSFIAYAMAVNVSRAIPDVRDGLKPVHRRILYAMNEISNTSDKPHKKCARIVGEVLGKYHPHGDASVYAALVRLAQDFSIRYTLVDGHGNFGSIDNDPPAAQRYTEARLSKISDEMLRDIEKETVDQYPNFDDTLMQPTVMPAGFPNLLVNGADGIAVGMATNIPPHNLREVIDACVLVLDDPTVTVDELMILVPGPDYPTGGVVMGKGAMYMAYRTGHGGVTVRAKTAIEEYTGKDGGAARSRIAITELPYQVYKSELIEQIAELVKDKRIEGISDIRDESDRKEGIRIVLEIKRDAQAQVVLNMLFKHTNLQSSTGINFLSLVNGEPRVLNLKEMIVHYVEHRKDVIVRRTRYDLAKAEEKAHILEGIVKVLDDIDKAIAIIKASRDKFEAAEGLIRAFILTDKQANAILEMRLQRLTSLEVESLRREYAELLVLIADLKAILASPERVIEIAKSELLQIREKYGDDRRTEICQDLSDIDIGDLIEREDVVISMTHFGYIKRLPTAEYKTQRRGGRGVTAHKPKEEDFVEDMFITCTHDDLMFFTNKGRVFVIKAYEVPEAQKQARGRAIVNLLQLADGEIVSAVIPMKEDAPLKGNLMMATRQGLVKKTALTEFENVRKTGKKAITLLDDDELISVQLTSGRDEILMASSEGKCIRFSEEDVRQMGRGAQGVRSMKLNKGDYVVDMTVLKPNYHILTVSGFGYGKRTEIEDYRLQSRAGKGIKAGIFNEKTGKLVNLKLVAPDEDIMVISDDGTIIRMRAQEISVIGRDTQGVRLMKIKQECAVVCVAVAKAEAEDDEGVEGAAE